MCIHMRTQTERGWRSRCSVASMAATVACAQLRTGFVREMRGDGGRAHGRQAGGASPVLSVSVSHHAPRSAATCQLVPLASVSVVIAKDSEGGYMVLGPCLA